jgi:hypothetical protein
VAKNSVYGCLRTAQADDEGNAFLPAITQVLQTIYACPDKFKCKEQWGFSGHS